MYSAHVASETSVFIQDHVVHSTVAYKQAALNTIAYLMKVRSSIPLGLSRGAHFRLNDSSDIVSSDLFTPIPFHYLLRPLHSARQQACKSRPSLHTSSKFSPIFLSSDLLLSAAPVESHVGAIVVRKPQRAKIQ